MKKLLILSFIISCAAVYAETTENIRLKETVVTGTGFDDTQSSQIKNIFVIRKEDIENRGYNSVEDILKNVPGVNFVHNGFGMVADIRGQGSTEATKRVKILVDGIPMNILDLSHGLIPINTIPVNSIEKIEIINGGGAVLYGSGTSGGVINIITRTKQKENVAGKVYYQNSSFATNKVGFNTGIKLADNFKVDLAYEYLNGNGYRDREKDKFGDFRGGFTYNITDKQTLRFKASKYKQNYFELGALTLDEVKQNRKQAGSNIIDGDLDRTEYSLNYDIQATDRLNLSISAYKQEAERKYDQISKVRETVRGKEVEVGIDTDGLFKDKKKGLNLKGIYKYNSGQFIFGYEYLNADATRNVINAYSIPTPRGIMRADSETFIDLKKDTNSFFILNRHSLTDKLESTIGYRYEHSKYDINRKAYATAYGIRSNDGNINKNKTKENHAYELGLNYRYSDTGNIYTKYERGFRSPSPTELVDKVAGSYVLNDIDSEIYDTFEIGLKDMIGPSFVSATAFFTKTKDEIYTDLGYHITNPRAGWKFENLQETERKGIELFAEQYFNKLRINESLTYVDAEVSKGNKKGNDIPYVSKFKATVGTNYDISKNIAINANINFYSAPKDNKNNKLSSYTTADVGVIYSHESGFGLQVGIKNLFDKKYYKYESIEKNEYLPAQERRYYIGASYSF